MVKTIINLVGQLAIMDGAKLSASILGKLKKQISAKKIVAKLVAVQLGSDPASDAYINRKKKACEDAGIAFERIGLPLTTSQSKLIETVEELNAKDEVTGIIVQLPLPEKIKANEVIDRIHPLKDVDGLTTVNTGRLWSLESGSVSDSPFLLPCTGLAVTRLLEEYGVELVGKHVVVIGRSMVAGKPIAASLLAKGAGVTILHKDVKELMDYTLTADVLVSATGVRGLVKANMVSIGSVIVDVGITRVGKELFGDVDPSVSKKVKLMTPVPGGVGPMTVAMLISNVVKAHQLQKKQG